ncbi:hypothetical protein WKI65_37200 [Streptomyces sp. MS1.AVA.3]|uniref:hypothetical protein n=1 Tax=Streptomyces decoyicus TaxID=249567 RepID=UPI0030C59814
MCVVVNLVAAGEVPFHRCAVALEDPVVAALADGHRGRFGRKHPQQQGREQVGQ